MTNTYAPKIWRVLVASATAGLGALLARGIAMDSDEVATIQLADRTLGGLSSGLQQGTQGAAMVPYQLGLWVWVQMGESDWWVRMFSVLGGVATIWLLFGLAERWVGARAALAVCGVTLANPFFHRYLIEARSYSWLMALCLATVIIADRLIRNGRASDAVWLGVLGGLGLASHVLFIVILGSLAVAVVISGSVNAQLVRRLAVSAGIAMLIFSPVLSRLLQERGSLAQNAPASPKRFFAVTSTAFGSLPTSALIIVGIITLVVSLVVKHRRDWEPVLLACLAIGSPLFLAGFSLVGDDVYNSRYLAPTLPLLVLAAVYGFQSAWPATKGTVVLLAISGCFLVTGLLGPSVHDYRPSDPVAAAAFLRANVASNDAIIFEPNYVGVWIDRYWDGSSDLDPTSLGHIPAELAAEHTIWLVTLLRDSPVLEEIEGDRVTTAQSFGALRVVEINYVTD